jgi:phosphoribosylformylglycinamidine synthase
VVVEISGKRLIDDCPVYQPAAQEDPQIAELRGRTPHLASRIPHPGEALLELLDHPPVASKRWVYEQYDSTIQAGTVIGPGGDAGVIRVRDADFGIAVTTDGNSRYVLLDPYEGGKAAVAEAARNVACTGARPLGITDCLNFGSPERPAVFYQFREACRGIAEACRALDTPVTGGNVSFYNESPTGAVDPTPVIGMVGLLSRVDRAVPSHAQAAGDAIFVLGETRAELGGSQLWEAIYQFDDFALPGSAVYCVNIVFGGPAESPAHQSVQHVKPAPLSVGGKPLFAGFGGSLYEDACAEDVIS